MSDNEDEGFVNVVDLSGRKVTVEEVSEMESDSRVIRRLIAAIDDAELHGYTQVAMVLSKPGVGWQSSFVVDDSVESGSGIMNLLGTVEMLKAFIVDTAAADKS